MNINQYDIWIAELPRTSRSAAKKGRRPVVVSGAEANDGAVLSVVPCTAQLETAAQPTHVYLSGQGLDRPSIALCGQVMALDRRRLIRRVGCVYQDFDRLALRHALAVQLGLAA